MGKKRGEAINVSNSEVDNNYTSPGLGNNHHQVNKINNNNKFLLKQNTYRDIKQILNLTNIPEKETYNLIRNFFKLYLDLDYEFTNEELKKELKKVYFSHELKEDTSLLFDSLSKIEYFSEPLSQPKLRKLLLNFKKVIDEIVTVHYKKESSFVKKFQDSLQGFLHHHLINQVKINKKFSKKYNVSIKSNNNKIDKEIPSNERSIDKHITSQDNINTNKSYSEKIKPTPKALTQPILKPTITTTISKINKIILEANNLYDTDLIKAKQSYSELLKLYDILSDLEKKKTFNSIKQVYLEIKKRIK